MVADTARPVALITGAARRIGAATARALHTAGYDLALHYRHSGDDMHTLCAELERARSGSTLSLRADLSDVSALPGLIESTVARFGHLDALINNASAYYATPLATATAAQWHELFAANACAPFFLAQAAAPHLRQTSGAIVNLTDYYAGYPQPEGIPYAASKAALVAVTRGLALALAPHVRVNAIAPGAICWPEDGADDAARAAILSRTPLARTGTAEDIADTVRWLLGDAAFVTGQVIHVDGGRSLAS